MPILARVIYLRATAILFCSIAVGIGYHPQLSPGTRFAFASAKADTDAQSIPRKESYWVSIAGEFTEGPASEKSTVQVNAYRSHTREDAEAKVLSACRAKSGNPQNCRVRSSFNDGCQYAVGGTHPFGDAGYAFGRTPQEAYDACYAKNLNCDAEVSGGCSNPADDVSRKVVIGPRLRTWGAIAVGTGKSGTDVAVSVAITKHSTKTGAEKGAVLRCNSHYDYVTCKLVGSFNKGCVYHSIGTTGGRSSYAGWGLGATPQEALARCKDKVEDCNEPKGYCVTE